VAEEAAEEAAEPARPAAVSLLLAVAAVAVVLVAGAVSLGGWAFVGMLLWAPAYLPTLCALPFVVRMALRLWRGAELGEAGPGPLVAFAWLPGVALAAGPPVARVAGGVVLALLLAGWRLAPATARAS
jgi:hypothetical protein